MVKQWWHHEQVFGVTTFWDVLLQLLGSPKWYVAHIYRKYLDLYKIVLRENGYQESIISKIFEKITKNQSLSQLQQQMQAQIQPQISKRRSEWVWIYYTLKALMKNYGVQISKNEIQFLQLISVYYKKQQYLENSRSKHYFPQHLLKEYLISLLQGWYRL